jgi:RES domain-containing protein
MPPGTLVSYTVRLSHVVDFSAGYDGTRWHDLWEEFDCDWRELWFNRRVEPPSWVLADEALAAGAKGILFASTLASGGMNLVVFNEQLTADDTLQVYDLTGALPKNQDSWR